MHTNRLAAAIVVLASAGCSAPPTQAPAAALAADLVLVNGRILTVDANDSVAEALAVKGGRIIAVGPRRDIEALAGPSTERIDLQGRAATPGLIDAHAHFSDGGTGKLRVIELGYPAVQKAADAVELVRTRVSKAKPKEWIVGDGWDEGKLAERRYLYASDLDPVSPQNPVALWHTTGHYIAANSAALALAGVTKATKDPAGGTIDRLADGSPSGVLKENAMALVTRLVPDFTESDIVEGIAYIAKEFNKEGMTGVKEPGIALPTWRAYQQAAANGALTVRTFVLWRSSGGVDEATALAARVAPFSKPYISTGDDLLISGGIKVFMDGSGGARTAWMHDDWSKNYTETDAGNKGYPTTDAEVVRKQIRIYHDAGLHVSTHAIGDRAIDWVVDSYAQALAANPARGRRHGIIHANVPTDRALDEIARLQREFDAAYPEPSGSFMWWIGDTYAGNFGKVRSLRLDPFKTFQTRRIMWAGGSDFQVTPFPARYGIWSSVARETLLGVHGKTPFGAAEAVDVKTALRSFTIWGAHQLFLDQKTGSLEVGKYADIAVWNIDPYTAPTSALKDMQCQMTILGGKVVFRREPDP